MLQTIVAGLVFLLAISLPVVLLKQFHSLAWPWHALAILAAVAIGLAPGTPLLNSVFGTLLYGFAIGFLGIWGIGGLLGVGRKRATLKPA